MYRILITGSRTWTDREAISSAISNVILENKLAKDEVIIVHGACPRGADNLADEICTNWGANVEKHPADWDRYGRSSGHVRNQKMVNLGANICLAFIENNSPGASGTVKLCERAGIPVIINER